MEKKDALFTVLEKMDEQAAPWAPLPAVVWQACIIDFLITQASPTQATLRLQPVEAGEDNSVHMCRWLWNCIYTSRSQSSLNVRNDCSAGAERNGQAEAQEDIKGEYLSVSPHAFLC